MNGESVQRDSGRPVALSLPVNQRESAWLGLVQKMAGGDQDALATLYDQTSGVLYALALRVVRNREDAEEVVLDVYSRAWRLARNFDPARGGVLTWLIMMTRSIAIDRLRSGAAKAEKTEALDEPRQEAAGDPDPELTAMFREQRERINAALDQLPPEQRQAVELAFFGGLSHSEMADRLGVPLGTIKTRVRLGLARLRGSLEGLA